MMKGQLAHPTAWSAYDSLRLHALKLFDVRLNFRKYASNGNIYCSLRWEFYTKHSNLAANVWRSKEK